MNLWFQNLNEDKRKLFHFRGSIGPDWRKTWLKYEVSSGPALGLEYQHGGSGDTNDGSMLILGLGVATLYLTFFLPGRFYFKRKCVATWDNNREFYLIEGRRYGVHLYGWDIVWDWHSKPWESSSSDPLWMHGRFSIDDFFLGRRERLEDVMCSVENVKFKLGGKEFVVDSIKWERNRSFRRHIPFSLYHREWVSVHMEISKPPMHAGKGENSWDLDDDGSFGLSMKWRHAKPSYLNRDEMKRIAVEEYVSDTLKDAKRYGAGSGDRGVRSTDAFEYVG